MKPTKEMLEIGAFAVMVSNGCGVMVGDERVMCDDERLGDDKDARCQCREDFTAGLIAALSASPAGVGVETPPPSTHLMGQIAALQEWSEQKYGQAFSISACHDLLNVLKTDAPTPHLHGLALELLQALCGELRLNRGAHQDLINRARSVLSTPSPQPNVEADRLRRMVERRDEFIISKGLWDQFKEASREAQ